MCIRDSYVIVPDPYDGLQVTKGGVFSYYEFGWPSSDRLTDEKWLQMLKDGEAPEQPEWTSSLDVYKRQLSIRFCTPTTCFSASVSDRSRANIW